MLKVRLNSHRWGPLYIASKQEPFLFRGSERGARSKCDGGATFTDWRAAVCLARLVNGWPLAFGIDIAEGGRPRTEEG